MRKSIDHYASASLAEYLNYCFLSDLDAYQTVTLPLYPAATKYYTASGQPIKALASSKAGWVYDSTIGVIPTISGFPLAQPDYRNGRFLFPDGSTPPSGVSGNFTYPEINVYTSSYSESKIIFETNFDKAPDYSVANTGLPEGSFVTPCVFIKSYRTEQEDLALGGCTDSIWNFRLIVFAENESQLLNIQSVIRKAKTNIFPLIRYPVLDNYNNLQISGWNWPAMGESEPNYFYVTDSTFKIQENDLFTERNPNLYLGIGNIDVSFYGNSRAEPNLDITLLQMQTEPIVQLKSGPLIEL